MPVIIALGIITSYQDIKFGKIRNKWIIAALTYSVLLYIILITFYLFQGKIQTPFLAELGTNFLFSIIIGFGLWYFRIWTAGDGKLFIAYSALLPLSVYSQGYQKWIPSLTLLVNIFIPSLIIMLILMAFKVRIKDIKKASLAFLKEFFHLKQLFNSIVYLFAIYWIVGLLLSLIKLGDNYLLKVILTMLIFSFMQKRLKTKAMYVMLAIALLRFFIDKSIYSLSFWVDFLIVVFIWVFIKSFLRGGISKLGQEVFAKEINVNKLKPGMILSIQEKEKISNFVKEEVEGLTQKQINKIRKMGLKKVKISQTIPFAPFMFLGIILTIIAKGNILIVINNII